MWGGGTDWCWMIDNKASLVCGQRRSQKETGWQCVIDYKGAWLVVRDDCQRELVGDVWLLTRELGWWSEMISKGNWFVLCDWLQIKLGWWSEMIYRGNISRGVMIILGKSFISFIFILPRSVSQAISTFSRTVTPFTPFTVSTIN